jgi:hypothetical protein
VRLLSHSTTSQHLTRDHIFIQTTAPYQNLRQSISISPSKPALIQQRRSSLPLQSLSVSPTSSNNPFRNSLAEETEAGTRSTGRTPALSRALSINTQIQHSARSFDAENASKATPPLPQRPASTSKLRRPSTFSDGSSNSGSASGHRNGVQNSSVPPPPPPSRRSTSSATVDQPTLATSTRPSTAPILLSRASSVSTPTSKPRPASISTQPLYQIPAKSGSGSWGVPNISPGITGYQLPAKQWTNLPPDQSQSHRNMDQGHHDSSVGRGLGRSKTLGSRSSLPPPLPPPKRRSKNDISSSSSIERGEGNRTSLAYADQRNPFDSAPSLFRPRSLSSSSPPSPAINSAVLRSTSGSAASGSRRDGRERKELKDVLVESGKDFRRESEDWIIKASAMVVALGSSATPLNGTAEEKAKFARREYRDESSDDDEDDDDNGEQDEEEHRETRHKIRQRKIEVEREIARETEIGWSQI